MRTHRDRGKVNTFSSQHVPEFKVTSRPHTDVAFLFPQRHRNAGKFTSRKFLRLLSQDEIRSRWSRSSDLRKVRRDVDFSSDPHCSLPPCSLLASNSVAGLRRLGEDLLPSRSGFSVFSGLPRLHKRRQFRCIYQWEIILDEHSHCVVFACAHLETCTCVL